PPHNPTLFPYTTLFRSKPSRGRISHAPGGQSFLSQAGPMSRTVLDAAAFLDVVSGYATGDSWWAQAPQRSFAAEATTPPGRLRIDRKSTRLNSSHLVIS